MKPGLLPKCLLAAALALLAGGCVVHRTIKDSSGNTTSSGYVLKRPLSGTGGE